MLAGLVHATTANLTLNDARKVALARARGPAQLSVLQQLPMASSAAYDLGAQSADAITAGVSPSLPGGSTLHLALTR